MSEVIEFKGIERVNEFTDPELLKKTEVVTLDNLILDKVGGKAIKRGAITPFNTNSAGGGVNSLHDVVDASGNNYLLAATGTTLKASANGTAAWSTLKSGLTNGLKTKIVPYLDKYIVTNGTDAIFQTDLSTTWSLEITAPVVTSIVSEEAEGGELSIGRYPYYRYILVYVTELGELSAPSQPFSHLFFGTSIGDYKTIRFNSLPVSADSRVVSRLLFRTQSISNNNPGSVYYLLATLDNSQTYFVDNFSDFTLDTSKTIQFVTIPSKANNILIHKERLFLGNITFVDKNQLMPEFTKKNTSPDSGYRAGYEFNLANSTSTGSLTAGTYKYRLALIDSIGRISDYIEIQTTLSGGENTVVFLDMPCTPSADYTLKIYRTKVGGSTFYELPYISGPFNDTLTDKIADASLTVTMPSAGTTAYKSGIAYSEVGQPASITAYNILQINPDDGDQIVKLIDGGDRIYVWKTNSIYQILTLGHPQNWQIELLYSKKGCDQPDMVCKAGEKIYFIVNKQVFRFPDYMEKPISLNKINTFKGVNSFTDMFYSNYYNWLFVIADGDMLIYDEKLDAWYEFYCDDQTWKCGVEKIHGSNRDTLVFGHYSATLLSKYNISSFVDDDNSTQTEIITDIIFKTLVMNAPEYRARLRKILANYKKRDDQAVNHQLYSIDDQTQRYSTDSTNSTNPSHYKFLLLVTDAMSGTLIDSFKFFYRIYGAGLNEFNNAKIFYNPRRRIRSG